MFVCVRVCACCVCCVCVFAFVYSLRRHQTWPFADECDHHHNEGNAPNNKHKRTPHSGCYLPPQLRRNTFRDKRSKAKSAENKKNNTGGHSSEEDTTSSSKDARTNIQRCVLKIIVYIPYNSPIAVIQQIVPQFPNIIIYSVVPPVRTLERAAFVLLYIPVSLRERAVTRFSNERFLTATCLPGICSRARSFYFIYRSRERELDTIRE